jgi:hypothetical protein
LPSSNNPKSLNTASGAANTGPAAA